MNTSLLFLDFLSATDDMTVWVIIPLFVFFARFIDVSIGTMRIMLLSRGMKIAVAVLGFLETLLWIITITQVLKHLDSLPAYLAWAGGFSAGSILGMWIVGKLAFGNVVVRIITPDAHNEITSALQKIDTGYTLVDGEGRNGAVKIIFIVVSRKNLNILLNTIQEVNPNIFYSIEDVASSNRGIFPANQKNPFLGWSFLTLGKKS